MKRLATSQINKAKFLRQRRFFLFLPVLVMPSVCVLFYLLGGGSNALRAEGMNNNKGLNTSLPNAHIKKENSWNKLQYYEQADRDSIKRSESIRNENSYPFDNSSRLSDNPTDSTNHVSTRATSHSVNSSSTSTSFTNQDSNEEAVFTKLAQIDKALNATPKNLKEVSANLSGISSPTIFKGNNSDDIKRLEKLMSSAGSRDDSDEEMTQLSSMLDKIRDVQHPDRVNDAIREESIKNKQQVYTISTTSDETGISLLGRNNADSATANYNSLDSNTNVRLPNAFYSLDEPDITPENNNAVTAYIDETRTVTAGSTVKLRLGEDVYLGGLFVSKNTSVYGVAALEGERLHITINSIRCYNSILPVALSVYDLDGLEGIYIPGAITGEVLNSSTDRAVSGIGLGSLDPSLKAQAANAGIEAAKSLLSKKARLIKVTLKAGYQLLLKAKNAQ